MTQPKIRLATPQDDLSALLGPLTAYRWNREQVLVADLNGEIVGMMLLWDGGHEVVHVDNLVVKDGHLQEQIGMALMRGCEAEAKRRGAKVITASTPNVRLASACARKGLKVSIPLFALWREID